MLIYDPDTKDFMCDVCGTCWFMDTGECAVCRRHEEEMAEYIENLWKWSDYRQGLMSD